MGKLIRLTTRSVETSKPGSEIRDSEVRGLRLRTSPKGLRTFVFVTRYPGQQHASRRSLTATTLKAARDEAAEWKRLVRHGIDPYAEERRKVQETIRKHTNTFASAAKGHIAEIHRRKQRKASEVEHQIRKELISKWGERPISDITRQDVIELIQAIRDRPAPYYAFNVLGYCRLIFNWAIDGGLLEASPCDRIRPAKLMGERKPRQRVLSDDEIRAFWLATEKLGYPLGSNYQMLLLTGQRKSEVSKARWRELDLGQRLWTVPPERFKSDSSHLVPLTSYVVALLETLPRFKSGDHLFSFTHGTTPMTGHSAAKERLDKLMLAELRKKKPAATLAPFVIHDLRRTVRTRLSALRVSDTVSEMVIGHGRRGLQRVYDQHKFVDEMREALDAWNMRLRAIVEPPGTNIISIGRA
jgi:integrase